MTSFSSLMSSIGSTPQTPQPTTTNTQKPNASAAANVANGVRFTANNAAAGVKRKSEEPESAPRPKTARTDSGDASKRPEVSAPPSRFQLSARSGIADKPSALPNRPVLKPGLSSSNPQKQPPKPIPKPNSASPISTATPTSATPAPKRGFASVMEKAKAAQEAAKASGTSGIKHKPVEKMTKRERIRLMEEAKESERAAKSGRTGGSRSGTPSSAKPGFRKPSQEPASKVPVKKTPAPLSYKGTMRTASSIQQSPKKKSKDQDEYADWSDLDNEDEGEASRSHSRPRLADEEDEDGYDSEASSDMEGGFDDVQHEEELALRMARKEDQEALAEEDRLRREKAERKRKLMALSKSRAGMRKF